MVKVQKVASVLLTLSLATAGCRTPLSQPNHLRRVSP